MSRPTILLIGAGGHARACIDVVESEGRFAIGGLVGSASEVGQSILGYPVLGTDEDIPQLVAQFQNAVIVVGQIKSPDLRIALFNRVRAAGASLPAVVSPRSYVSPHATIGAGTVVLSGAVINASASVGENCIINSQALVEHDCRVGSHCHIATGAKVNSGVRIGDGVFVGSNASIRQMLSIGDRCVIGMGERVFADCPSGSRVSTRPVS